MKHLTIFAITLLISVFASQYTFGQQGSVIDSLKIIPNNPTVDDNAQLIVYTTFTSGDCNLNIHSLDIQNNNINVLLNYTVGVNTAICHSVDTLTIGNLNSGNYELTANLTVNVMNAIFDTDTISFTVANALSVIQNSLDKNINIYPNPFINEIQIKTSPTMNLSNIEIYSAIGSIIKQMKFDSDGKVNVSDLNIGMNFIVLTDKNGNRYTKKIIKKAL